MNEFITQLSFFKADTPREELEEWATLAQAEIDRMNEKEGAVYYLVLSEFYAVYLRDIQTGYEMLKRINMNMACITDQVKVRRCLYKYLEGAYEFALEELADIIDRSSNLASKKIAVDFFRRVFQRELPTGQTKFKSKLINRESYEQDFLKALKYERSGSSKLALEMHRAIFTKYGSISEVILYESAKHIDRLLQTLNSRVERQELEGYRNIIRDFELKTENKNYFDMKFQFISRVLDFIDPQNQDEEAIIDYQLSKNFIIENLQKAIAKATDKQIISSLKATLTNLQENDKIGEEICYKFLGDKAYGKLLLHSSIPEKSKVKPLKKKQSKIQENEKEEQQDRPPSKSIAISKKQKQQTKDNVSKVMKRGRDRDFEGSKMVKINFNSGGYEQRFFYVNEDFLNNKKLYFCSAKSKRSNSDDYYSLKGLKTMTVGKLSEALKRQECDQFPEDHCFTLQVNNEEKYERNFYVKQIEDYQNWVALFEELLNSQKSMNTKMKKTRVIV